MLLFSGIPVPEADLLYPLNEFYQESGVTLPAVRRIEPDAIPEPYRSLLVHDRDMTPTLEAAYGQAIHLHVLRYTLSHDVFSRHVLLVLEDDATAVELGAIKIYLDYFPPEARRLVLERMQPLGTILRTQGIVHESRPAAYIHVTADALISEAFHLSGPAVLYGRRNALLDSSQHTLAQVVEILPPAIPATRKETTRG